MKMFGGKSGFRWYKKAAALLLGVAVAGAGMAEAHPIRTPEGNMPVVHWAVVVSTPGQMGYIGELGAKILGSVSSQEAGTYALYGCIDKDDADTMRLLEIYESNEAYRIHGSSEAFQKYRAARYPVLKELKILEVNGIVLEQKAEGTGTFAILRRYEANPKSLAEFQELTAAEARRAVRDDDGVLGMYITAEQPRPDIFHTMELFSDEAAYKAYVNSSHYKNWQNRTNSMITKAATIENRTANIPLSKKGLQISK